MTTALKIDFVSDIACPWCAVGLGALEQALEELHDEVKAAEIQGRGGAGFPTAPGECRSPSVCCFDCCCRCGAVGRC